MKILSCIQWFINGDHPLDHDPEVSVSSEYDNYYEYKASPGAVVGIYDDSKVAPQNALPYRCPKCGLVGQSHGLLTSKHSHARPAIVCPGDYIAEVENAEYIILIKKD